MYNTKPILLKAFSVLLIFDWEIPQNQLKIILF